MKEKIPSLEELGGHQLYPQDPSVDRRPALRSILRSILVTYSKLLDSLLAPPPTSSSQLEAEWKQHLEWINILAQNIMAAANYLRPVQARGNLELMMRWQLELRREETKAIHTCVPLALIPLCMRSQSRVRRKCDALEAQLAELRMSAQGLASPTVPVAAVVPVGGQATFRPEVCRIVSMPRLPLLTHHLTL